MSLSPALATALTAVAEACRVTRAVQRQLADVQTLTKADLSPVTVADFAAQAVVCLRLGQALGTFRLVGEESAAELREAGGRAVAEAVTAAVRTIHPGLREAAVLDAIDHGNHDATGGTYWTLDPIDGTKGFLRGGQYAVSLALIEHGRVTTGVLGCPNLGADFSRAFDDPDPTGTLFHATTGNGAFSLPANATPAAASRIQVATGRPLSAMRMCESVEAAHSALGTAARIRSHLGVTAASANLDSQCKYAVVARGQADAYLRLPTRVDYVEHIWDHAAGVVIATEAGATVTDKDGHPLDFSKGAGLTANRGVVCAAPAFHGPLLEAIAALFT